MQSPSCPTFPGRQQEASGPKLGLLCSAEHPPESASLEGQEHTATHPLQTETGRKQSFPRSLRVFDPIALLPGTFPSISRSNSDLSGQQPSSTTFLMRTFLLWVRSLQLSPFGISVLHGKKCESTACLYCPQPPVCKEPNCLMFC